MINHLMFNNYQPQAGMVKDMIEIGYGNRQEIEHHGIKSNIWIEEMRSTYYVEIRNDLCSSSFTAMKTESRAKAEKMYRKLVKFLEKEM